MSNSAMYIMRGFSSTRTSGKNEHVELVLIFRRLHTLRCDLKDWVRTNVNKVNVALVEDLVEILFLTWTLATKRVRWEYGG